MPPYIKTHATTINRLRGVYSYSDGVAICLYTVREPDKKCVIKRTETANITKVKVVKGITMFYYFSAVFLIFLI